MRINFHSVKLQKIIIFDLKNNQTKTVKNINNNYFDEIINIMEISTPNQNYITILIEISSK